MAAVSDLARQEMFAPGQGDIAIYCHTDRQGIWVGWLGQERIGSIAGVRYTLPTTLLVLANKFLVVPRQLPGKLIPLPPVRQPSTTQPH